MTRDGEDATGWVWSNVDGRPILSGLMIFAYIDPNAGSLVIQAVIAMLVAVPFFFRRQLARAVRVIRPDRDEDRRNPG
jgi:hypothetical protein